MAIPRNEIKSSSRIDVIGQNGNDGEHYQEIEPDGKDQHSGGAKLDGNKNRMSLVLDDFANALLEVGKVGTYGAKKYTDSGWTTVENAIPRYKDAMLRHHFQEAAGEEFDVDTNIVHAAHRVWNDLAVLELMLLESKNKK